MKITITGKNGTQEYEFDENDIQLTDNRERIFKENGKWYITKLISNDFTKWVEETQSTIIEDKKIEKLSFGDVSGTPKRATENDIIEKINEIIEVINGRD